MSDALLDDPIEVRDVGRGPTVLCLHGVGATGATFEPQLAELADDLRLLAWDAPGTAGTTGITAARTPDEYADLAARVARAAGAGPVHVLGVGWGGVIATRMAVRHPDSVRSLVLAGSSRGAGCTPGRAEQLGGIRVPTLVLAGDADSPGARTESQALAGAIPDATFVVLHRAGARPNEDRPETFNAWLHSFVLIVERLYR